MSSKRHSRTMKHVEKHPPKEFRLRTLSTTYVVDERTKELVLLSKMKSRRDDTAQKSDLEAPSMIATFPGTPSFIGGTLSKQFLPSTPSKNILKTTPSRLDSSRAVSKTASVLSVEDKPSRLLLKQTESQASITTTKSMVLGVIDIDEEEAKMQAMIIHMKQLISLMNLKDEIWERTHDNILRSFLTSKEVSFILVYFNAFGELRISFEPVSFAIPEMFYFIKRPCEDEITLENFSQIVHYGNMKANFIVSLLRHMNQIFIPLIMRNKVWPSSIKNDFIGQLYKFMAMLTDIRYKMKGQTVFYIPDDIEDYHLYSSSSDRDMVQRLEGIMTHWIRQMKDLSGIESLDVSEKSGPNIEIEFWECRKDDLNGVVQQLNKPTLKHLVHILELAKSSYLPSFAKLSRQIENNSIEANSNHKFLLLLKDPCLELSASTPDAIPAQLPALINIIRFIWVNSPYFNTRERITGMFRKVSNEIIIQCCKSISEDQILDGYSVDSIKIIKQCIFCCNEWKKIYHEIAGAHQKFSNRNWLLDSTSIFAQIDAFVQRCSDLIMICDCQIHFGRREYGERKTTPACFSGRMKNMLIQNMVEVDCAFDHSLEFIIAVKDQMLDIRSAKWHDSYSKFYMSIKELDVMIQNNINLAFDYVRNVREAVLVIDAFSHFRHRDTINRILDRKIHDTYQMLSDDISAVRKEFSQKNWMLYPSYPFYAGHAYFALCLRQHIDRPTKILFDAWWMPTPDYGEELLAEHENLVVGVNDYINKMFQEWLKTVDDEATKRLDIPIYVRSFSKPGLIECNMDRSVLKQWQEVMFWKRLHYQVPPGAIKLYEFRDILKPIIENVMHATRDYNKVISSLSRDEQLLFKERIAFMDRKMQPGLTKVTWSSPATADAYVYDCRPVTAKVQNLVETYKTSQIKIGTCCQRVSELRFLHIDTKKVYEEKEFEYEQKHHRLHIREKILEYHATIISISMSVFEIFKGDGFEVQKQWAKLAERVDMLFEEALRVAVRKTLKEVLKALAGEDKVAPLHLFKVKVVLNEKKIDFEPTMKTLSVIISNTMQDCCLSLSGIPRLANIIATLGSVKEAFEKVVLTDDESLSTQSNLNYMMSSMAMRVQTYLHVWEPYRDIWEVNKEMFMKRYCKMQPTVATFDADIARYTEVANNVQTQDSTVIIQFCVLDCLPLKISILDHCVEWQNKFTNLLKEMTVTKLHLIDEYLDWCKEKLSREPNNLDELKETVQLYSTVTKEKEGKYEEFVPLREQFVILAKYEISVSEEDVTMLQDLENKWQTFLDCLQNAEEMIKKNKEKFKNQLLSNADEMKKSVSVIVEDFTKHGPFSSTISSGDALDIINEMNRQLMALKSKEDDIRKGLTFFSIDQPPSRELQLLEKDLTDLKTIWELTVEWEQMWELNKDIDFPNIVYNILEDQAAELYRRIKRLNKDVQGKNWEICGHTLSEVDKFKTTLPAVVDMKNPSLRDRHWEQIKTACAQPFDQTSPDFTLNSMVTMNFDVHADVIHDISVASTKELQIEEQLKVISKLWDEATLDMGQYKDKIGQNFLRSADEVFSLLEEHQVLLTTMKASRFVRPFESTVDWWERTISAILEMVESTMAVQRLWMYLENIFVAEDIRKQLPVETGRFDAVNVKFRTIMSLFTRDNNALRASKIPKVGEMLTEMEVEMEDIQKSLDMYLETKRRVFPRFYFISNEDMLEILGQSKNPQAVQTHFKKLFDNINKIKTSKNILRVDGNGMLSIEGEYVEFLLPVVLEGPVEGWLCDIENMMLHTLREILSQSRIALRKQLTKRDKWMKDWPGQICIVANQIHWTSDCTKALHQAKQVGDRGPLKVIKKRQVAMLGKFTEAIRSNLPKLQRIKVVSLVTIEVHARDVIEKLIKTNCMDVNGFEWLSQLRFYWENNDCMTRQTNTQFPYQYEYLGCTTRLVITPLTDRCYITLTTALHLHRGGQPQGPAGTGKTETTKDLGKALGVYVIVINCSDGLDYISMGKMFAGMAQSGCWLCFDEFNRISIEVLSVVAQQVICILSALAAYQDKVVFQGDEIILNPRCGVFITMNPGYAGRTELPDNLKSMFRPISMMVPDLALISEIFLFGEGFDNSRVLAKKVTTLYALSSQQLSKQDHYDFGLRGLIAVLRHAGRKRRQAPHLPGEENLLLAMTDMNIPKMTAADKPLFNGIISDLFPGVELGESDYTRMLRAIETELSENHYQNTPYITLKIIQLFETKNSRHSTVIVGPTQSAKSVTWRTLQRILSRLCREGEPGYNLVREFPLNPKAIDIGELYGEFNLATGEWQDGVLSSIARMTCNDERPDEKWIVFDGPVDTLWIESMNSLMDDNKILTLINGDRIAMPEQVSLLFETQDMAVASPATVSRCGVVYIEYASLGWRPFFNMWLLKFKKPYAEELKKLFHQYLQKLLDFKSRHCVDLIPVSEMASVIYLCRFLETTFSESNKVIAEEESFPMLARLIFVFSCVWTICASVNENSRNKLDTFIREAENTIPNKDTVYDYFIDTKLKTWVLWEDRLPKDWKYNPYVPFYKILVPTVDTLRYSYVVNLFLKKGIPVMLVGPVGTGKTILAQSVMNSMPSNYRSLIINLSAQTTSKNVQDVIEGKTEKRTKGIYVPLGGKTMITFMDDFNMPAKDTFGSQPPLELIFMWLDYGFWYDRAKQTPKYVKDMIMLASMGPPGGGRTEISKRLQSRYALINMTFPLDSQIKRVYGTMINQKLSDFDSDVKVLGEAISQATIEIYNSVALRMLPTPAKIHYLYNLRDMSKVFQGMLRANIDLHNSPQGILRLWTHECFRVFSDRLNDDKDRDAFVAIISEKLAMTFNTPFHNLCPNRQPPIFFDALNEKLFYQDIRDTNLLKKYFELQLVEYNNVPGRVKMNIVPFQDAVEHLCRIIRVIRQPQGNAMLIGIGGSGRQSLSKLATFICGFKVLQIEVKKGYKKSDFREDLKGLFMMTGFDKKATVFIFGDTQIAEESFLEDINNMLSSGEVPNLFRPDELETIKSDLIAIAKREGLKDDDSETMAAYFLDRTKECLHVILCMSPIGEPFRNRVRMYPAFVNNTTIDWFSEWPVDALMEVARRFLSDLPLEQGDELRLSLAQMFSLMHKSVSDMSLRMINEIKRVNYVTPTNYLELVAGYKKLMASKREELGNAANKLRNGLYKLDDAREKVEVMSVELEDAKVKVTEFQKQCDEYLIIIVQQRRDADEQAVSIVAKSEKIGEEEVRCKKLADIAMADLAAVTPALEEALKALESLNKKDLTEIKSYGRPPPLVEKVMEAVMILRHADPTWAEAKRQLGEANFIRELKEYDKDNISDKVLKKISGYCAESDFQPDIVGKVSLAARSLCMWVRAMEIYAKVFRVVLPKRLRLQATEAELLDKQRILSEAKSNLQTLQERVEELQRQYDEKLKMKEELGRRANELVMKLDRAEKLVEGLGGEKSRWESTIQTLEIKLGFVPGDCVMAAGNVSYLGPFLSNYRDDLVTEWWTAIHTKQIPHDPEFKLAEFLVRPTAVREWNVQGLPTDEFSTINGIIVTRGNRWPLMIDPQCQAQKWIKNMEAANNLQVIDLQMQNYMTILELAIGEGRPTLLQNVKETLDASLNPILDKSVYYVGDKLMLKLGDKEILYNIKFRFYITTKMSNPHYDPEVASKVIIVNFGVKEQGLEAQLLGIVVRKERPELETMKDTLVRNIASGKAKLIELEDLILQLLSESSGSLLDDATLVDTLQSSKKTAEEVTEQVETALITEVSIDEAREQFRPSAERASILFFILNDLKKIDPMYEFSLDSYIDLFILSIDKSVKHANLDTRILNINDYHTYAVYRYTCRGLFEQHKLLFSFHMCAKILEAATKLNKDEYSFFLRGGLVLDHSSQPENPCGNWLSEASWDNITELEKLTNFRGVVQSFEQFPRDWYQWYISAEPEVTPLPGDWHSICNELERIIFVRCLRPDRVSICVASYVINNLGPRFVEPPMLDLNAVLEDSSSKTPLVFVLSSGVDPTSSLMQLAESKSMLPNFQYLSLGQGQSPAATRMIQFGASEGMWVFLANCHLSLSWMPQLEKLVEQLQLTESHPQFRLWLSSSPNPAFPISILQAGIKMTTEPPKGLKPNMLRLYSLVSETQFTMCKKPEKYKKLLFALCFFHSLILERRKFQQLGWNVLYSFNDSDFEVSENLLTLYLDEYEETAWDALKYLIAGVMYGGHVTDDWDRRLMMTYIGNFFVDDSLTTPFYKLSSLTTYYIPRDGTLQSYKDVIKTLPNVDNPEAFGQHSNADIAAQILETERLFETLLALQGQVSSGAVGESPEFKVMQIASDVLGKLPAVIDFESAVKLLAPDPSPLNVSVLQEIERYNYLLESIGSSLVNLQKGIQGLVVMSADLEEIFNSIFDNRVPDVWLKAYSSLKPLGSWTRDLIARVDQFATWATLGQRPSLIWLSAFTFPTGFLTAVLQFSARRNNIPIDMLTWEFSVSTVDDNFIVDPLQEGVWIRGMSLEGAGWDKKRTCLIEAIPMELVKSIPPVLFKPVENKKKSTKGLYVCPTYYYPKRTGIPHRPSFVVAVDLKTGAFPPEHWVKRATALLLSLSS